MSQLTSGAAGASPRSRLASITKKQIVALTGLAMAMFLIAHLSGNLLLLQGSAEAFNGYAASLRKLGPLLWVARIGLIAAFVAHVYFIVRIIQENRAAKGTRYAVSNYRGNPSVSVRTMGTSGLLILLFVALHLWHFTFTSHAAPRGVIKGADLGLYGSVYNSFHNVGYLAIYLLAMLVLGFHLDHAVQSAFKTFGFVHPRMQGKLRIASRIFAIAIAGGFAVIPLYIKFVNPEGIGQ